MNRETLEKAKDLENDIRIIEKLQKEKKEKNWINIISPWHKEHMITARMQNDLVAFLDGRKKQYEKELESL